MSRGAKFHPNTAGIAAIGRSAGVVAALRRTAEGVVERAKRIAPDAPPYGEGYIDGFGVDAGVESGKAKGRAYNDDFKANWIERGTVDTPAFRPLGRAVDGGDA